MFKLILLLSVVIFVFDKKIQYFATLILQLTVSVISCWWAVSAFGADYAASPVPFMEFFGHPVTLEIDRLSAFFIFVINFTMLTGILYAKGYLKPYLEKKNRIEFALHFFCFLWLQISMLLVCMVKDGLAFLFVWELMSLSSFFLVIFDSEKVDAIKAGIKYLIQMHIGFVFILIAFLVAFLNTHSPFGFEGLSAYFANNSPFLLFLLFFVGFGIKAGFIPLHTWLPHAHPAAPSHVSGVMSGVMIKIGIYGILRVLTYIHSDLLLIGVFILVMSLISGILGVVMAIAQHDIKKLLAYHSIENIGIIGIGIGVGTIGIALELPVVAALGYAGGILHILNHSLFKSLLFYSAGSVYQQTHTRNIEQLGGLIKKMPKSALFFLLGSLAICGLPPFNGFISEFLIYSGMFRGLADGSLNADILMLAGFLGLVLIGGLAVFCFTKVFSIVFLGTARSDRTVNATEVSSGMLFPKILIGILILAIGFLPGLFMAPLNEIVMLFTGTYSIPENIDSVFTNISIVSIGFVALVAILWMLRKQQQQKCGKEPGVTWGCGYTGANPAIHQYTATSYANNLNDYSNQIMNIHSKKVVYEEDEIFPTDKEFSTHSTDVFEDNLVSKPTNKILFWLEKMAVFQTGRLQHYLLYALIFLLLVFLLTISNVI
ncbi:MAG: NADH-quinone oxidoreductase subunit E [Bacteroidetes bacterium]|nr:NADH-quinone oxidoreductase subunit E [Bacteroidota bacterium]